MASPARPPSLSGGIFIVLCFLAGILLLLALGFASSRAWASRAGADAVPQLRTSLLTMNPAWTRHRDASRLPPNRPAIAIVIDDLGYAAGTRQAIALPAAVTLSFLPYPRQTPELARQGAAAGHEIILHMPMEPIGTRHNPGPMALEVGQSPREIVHRLDWALGRVPEAVGVNNHEGSLFTRDRESLVPVMQVLAKKNLFFLDSRTIAHSKAEPVARAFAVPTAGRNVFLDDVLSSSAIARQLRILEADARARGVAIAIGHPHPQTMRALARWTPQAAQKGFVLIPLSRAIAREAQRQTAEAE